MKGFTIRGSLMLLILLCTAALFAVEADTEWEDGILQFKSKDGAFSTRFDVRMYLDGAVYFENKNEDSMSDGTDLRRVRFAMKVKFWEKWMAEWDIDFATYVKESDEKDKGMEIKDMWLAYKPTDNSMIKVGNFKPPFSMEELTSSSKTIFLERAYPNVFTTGRRMGLGATIWWKLFHASAGVFGEAAENLDKKSGDEGTAYAIRFVAAPINKEESLIHAGVSFLGVTPDAVEDGDERSIGFDERPETSVARTKFLDTGDIYHVSGYQSIGGEIAGKIGPVYAQGEYIQTTVIGRGNTENAEFCGGYFMLGWFITGESRPYSLDEAEFSKPVPLKKYGAFEIAARYSHLDLTDEDAKITGGMANNYSLALNWYPNNNVRCMINYVYVMNSEYADGDGDYEGEDDFSYISGRILVNF